ncbi:MAG: hypothetical protein AAF108_06865 [Planctomycetota bacterium]
MSRRCLAAASLGLLGVAGLGTAGCDEVGAVYLLVSGPPKVAPVYELDTKRTTTVLIEARDNAAVPESVLNEIRNGVDEILVDKVDLRDVVRGASVARAAKAAPDFSLSDLARAVGADVIVHVRLESYAVSPDGQTFKPVAVMSVRVVDADSGEQVYPEGGEPARISASAEPKAGLLPPPGRDAEEQLAGAAWASLLIGQLFYEHQRLAAANKGPAT